jgi:hypothetical protein
MDELHNNFMSDQGKKKSEVPMKKERLRTLRQQLIELDNSKELTSTGDIKLKSNIKSEIKQLENDITDATDNDEMLNYVSKAGHLLVDYYDIINGDQYNTQDDAEQEELEKEITHLSEVSIITDSDTMDTNDLIDIIEISETETTSQETSNDYISSRLKSLHQASQKTRKVKKPVKKRQIVNKPPCSRSILSFLQPDDEEQESSTQKTTVNRATLQDKYLMVMDKSYACDKIKTDIVVMCTQCDIEKTLFQSEGRYICKKCGETEHIIMESEVPSHKELSSEKQKYPYKKKNHLKEKLNQFQSKESADVPEDVCDTVRAELKKQRIKYKDCTHNDVNKILKKHRMTSYYEHLQQIYCKISDTPPITLSRETEEEIMSMFERMQPSFCKHKPKNRSNSLSYSYVLNKYFRILGMNEYAKYFSLLISKEKLREQDMIWRKICEDMNWIFYSSF